MGEILETGWTEEELLAIKAGLHAWSEIWDDPDLDVYDELTYSPDQSSDGLS